MSTKAAGHLRVGSVHSSHKSRVPVSGRSCRPAIDPKRKFSKSESSLPPINVEAGSSEVAQTSFEPLLPVTLARAFMLDQRRQSRIFCARPGHLARILAREEPAQERPPVVDDGRP